MSETQILELVHVKIAELIGERGEWTVSRRSDDDTDAIFHSILATSVSVSITSTLVDAQRRLEAGEVIETAEAVVRAEAQHVASEASEPTVATETETVSEPAAFGWEPAPITIWTDLRKPVTGEFPAIVERTAA
ncbi:hypothetical protein [Leifsonia sp. NPDC058248]|uniref:hypothetical protein n=1 Tax=Leifsonia sp. NPDC058248 TaxID=3346402 RepID=UPI0036D7DB9C